MKSFDYYGSMVFPHSFRNAVLVTVAAVIFHPALAQTGGRARAPEPPPPAVESSDLDAELFYQIFLGEVSAQSGDPGAGYAFILEAARRSGDGRLYQRAADIALQSRSGDYALAAARAWKEALPDSREANRYVLQILIALNRIGETQDLLRQELALSPAKSRTTLLASLPQMYGRASDKALAAKVVESALSSELSHPANGSIAWTSIGRMRLAAGYKQGALDAARKAQGLDKTSESAAQLALELLDEDVADAEMLISTLLASPNAPELHIAYARILLGLQRFTEAGRQAELVIRNKPDVPEAWLILTTLQVQNNRIAEAEVSAQRLLEALTGVASADVRQRGLTQAYLLQAQIAEKKGDFAAAESWLGRIDNASDVFSAQSRRASLLARQGKVTQARELLRKLPASTDQDRRMKLLAEVQLLRDLRHYEDAYKVQLELEALSPDDVDFLYDKAMLAGKTGRVELMEQLLEQIIRRKPDHYNAYNALGYSLADRGQRLEEAKRLILKALELAPGDPFITDSLGWVEFRLGNKAAARRHLEDAFAKRPDVEIATHLGEVLWSLDEKEAALNTWREARRLAPDNEVLKETLQRLGAKP